jgi:hypothetical protein
LDEQLWTRLVTIYDVGLSTLDFANGNVQHGAMENGVPQYLCEILREMAVANRELAAELRKSGLPGSEGFSGYYAEKASSQEQTLARGSREEMVDAIFDRSLLAGGIS